MLDGNILKWSQFRSLVAGWMVLTGSSVLFSHEWQPSTCCWIVYSGIECETYKICTHCKSFEYGHLFGHFAKQILRYVYKRCKVHCHGLLHWIEQTIYDGSQCTFVISYGIREFSMVHRAILYKFVSVCFTVSKSSRQFLAVSVTNSILLHWMENV